MSNYERSYWELQADEELSKMRMVGNIMPRSAGRIYNNRKQTKGRCIQTINLKNGSTKQIRKPSFS